jgi:hypothetical protein
LKTLLSWLSQPTVLVHSGGAVLPRRPNLPHNERSDVLAYEAHGSASIAALAGGKIGANRQSLSQKYRRSEFYKSLTRRMPLKIGARVTRPSDKKLF